MTKLSKDDFVLLPNARNPS